jgi:hypothetical protein
VIVALVSRVRELLEGQSKRKSKIEIIYVSSRLISFPKREAEPFPAKPYRFFALASEETLGKKLGD